MLDLFLCVLHPLPHLYESRLWLNNMQEESGSAAVTECRPYISVGLPYFLCAASEILW